MPVAKVLAVQAAVGEPLFLQKAPFWVAPLVAVGWIAAALHMPGEPPLRALIATSRRRMHGVLSR